MDFKNFTTDDLVKLNKIHKKKKELLQEIETLENEYNSITLQMKSMGCIIDGRIEEPKTRHLRIGKKKFNSNPEEGMNYLVKEKIVVKTPNNVANFLSDYTLNKKSVGEYLGNISNPFNAEVLVEFVNLYDFSGLEFVDALRLLLTGFHLPGESQKIDKIVTLFSKCYDEQNPNYFKDASEAYIMTFAVIMLNTCLYNPTAKKCNGGFGREEDFVKIMKDFDKDTHFELHFVKKVFNNIKSQPLLCNPLSNGQMETFMNTLHSIDMSGWLWKLGGRIKSWKKRWFVLSDGHLYYLIHPDSSSVKGIIPLDNLCVRQTNIKSGKYCFEIYSNSTDVVKACKNDKDGRVELGHHTSYKIYCNSHVEMQQWIDILQQSINTLWQLKLLKNIE